MSAANPSPAWPCWSTSRTSGPGRPVGDGCGPPASSFGSDDGRAAGLTRGGVVLTVNGDGAVVERQLAGGGLLCPSCGGVLGGWGHARPRRVRVWGGAGRELVP